jgi:hypothetical protein
MRHVAPGKRLGIMQHCEAMTSDAINSGDRFVNENVWWPVRWTETVNRVLQRSVGFSLAKVDRKKITELIRVQHVHEAFGNQDQFRQLLESFLAGFEANQHLSAVGYFSINSYAMTSLQARKECMDYVFAHPDVLNQKLEKPVVITGMHRTGSTLLFNLMHQDERSRSTFMYETYGNWPHMPSASSRAAHYTDPRMASLKQLLAQAEKIFPEGTAKRNKAHRTSYDMIEEETIIVAHQLNWHMQAVLSGKEYKDLLFDMNKEYVFKYLRIYLQMLQTGYAPASHWTLKAPSHLLHIDSFMEAFPDARVVVLHRDPKATIASVSYLAEALFGSYWQPNTWDRHAIGSFAVELYKTMLERLMRYRDAHPEKDHQFLDIKFSDLEADPITQVQSIYRKFGIEYENSLTAKMQAYLTENKKHKYGKPDYSLAHYGVSPESIEKQFAEYVGRYLQ